MSPSPSPEQRLWATLLALSDRDFEDWLDHHPTACTDEMVQAAKALAEEQALTGTLLAKTLTLLERGEAMARRLTVVSQRPLAQALIWRGRANVNQFHEYYPESLAASEQAARLYERHGTAFDVAIARTVQVNVLGAMEQFEGAISLAHTIRPLFEQANFLQGLAVLADALAQVYTWMWRLDEAWSEYRRALHLYRRLGNSQQVATTLHNLGVLAYRMGRPRLSYRLYRRALTTFEATNNLVMVVKTQFNLAQLSQYGARYEDTLAHLAQARTVLRHLPDSPDQGYVALFEAGVRRALNDPVQAEMSLRRALDCFRRLERRLEMGETLLALSHLLSHLPHRLAEGVATLEEARTWLQGFDIPALLASIELEQAEQLLALGRVEEAGVCAEQAHAMFMALHLPQRQAQAALVLAESCWRLQPARAEQLYRNALTVLAGTLLLAEIRCWHGLGRLAAARGEVTAALSAYETAVEQTETLRRSLHGHLHQAGFQADKQTLMEELVGYLHTLPGRETQILGWVERFKANALADLLSEQPLPPQLDAVLETLLAQREQMASQLDQLSASLGSDQQGKSIALAQRRRSLTAHDDHHTETLLALRRSIQELDEEIARHQSPTLAWRYANTVDPAQIHTLLDDETFLVAYYTVGDLLYALTLSHQAGDVQIHPLPTSLRAVANDWRQAQRFITRPTENNQAVQMRLAGLWQKLIQPLETRLRSTKRLIIVPHRDLFHFPFAALYDAAHQRYLVEMWSVQVAPSATILAHCSKLPPAKGAALVVGYPGEPDHPRFLHHVAAEVETVTKHLKATPLFGAEATVENVLTRGVGCAVLHFACHADYDPAAPLESGLHLAQNRWLRASLLYQQYGRFRGTIAILGACNTGNVQIRGGEVLGLTSAFLYAGARSVIAGLWAVDDAATVVLMDRLYEGLAQGAGLASALRESQLAMLAGDYAHPFFWAPFVLSGASR